MLFLWLLKPGNVYFCTNFFNFFIVNVEKAAICLNYVLWIHKIKMKFNNIGFDWQNLMETFLLLNFFQILFSDNMHIRKELGMGPWPNQNNGKWIIVQNERLGYEKRCSLNVCLENPNVKSFQTSPHIIKLALKMPLDP